MDGGSESLVSGLVWSLVPWSLRSLVDVMTSTRDLNERAFFAFFGVFDARFSAVRAIFCVFFYNFFFFFTIFLFIFLQFIFFFDAEKRAGRKIPRDMEPKNRRAERHP